MIVIVPPLEESPWPTLGPQVCAWMERNLVHGPGDLREQPLVLDAEKRMLLYRAYEVYPANHARAGKRRFKRVAFSLRKGSAKTELAACIAAAELHPDAPVRCIAWNSPTEPIGGGVIHPYIPMVAYTEEQSEDLAYGALKVILEHSRVADAFDIGEERVMRVGGDGKAVPLASAPDARDGALTTFQHFDETHRFTLPKLRQAHQTMLRNIPKRQIADAWSLETTTAPSPGEGSVAEDAMEYAQALIEGRAPGSASGIESTTFFFFHRQASESHDLTKPEGVKAAVLEASGPVAEWSDIPSIVDQWNDPTADKAYLERVWLNRPVKASDRAFDAVRWGELKREGYIPEDRALIVIGFDGARTNDATALVATEIMTGFQWPLGIWEKPYSAQKLKQDWEVPEAEVDRALRAAFARWNVWRMYADPPYWEATVAAWSGAFLDKESKPRVIRWPTNRWDKIAYAVLAYANAILAKELTHNGEPAFARHVGNAYKRLLTTRDDKGAFLWVIQKERPDSPNKIDGAMAGILSWQARRDAVELGIGKKKRSKYETQEPLVIGGAPA